MKPFMNDIKLYALNGATFLTTMMTNMETILKIALLLISIGYTAHRWWNMHNDKQNKE